MAAARTVRYAAFLRGVSPMNAKMPDVKAAFEAAGFTEVRTLLSSGNVVFTARAASEDAIARKCEAAMLKHLGRTFMTFVRSVDDLRAMLEADPYARFGLSPKAKRVVTFLPGKPKVKPKLPVELVNAKILCLVGSEAFSAYVPGSEGPIFMTLIEKTFGKAVTTRTWGTIKKAAARTVERAPLRSM